MINTTDPGNFQLTWQAILWRLLLTIVLLIALAGFGLTGLETITSRSDTQVPPLIIQEQHHTP